MKKLVLSILTLVLCFGFFACDNTEAEIEELNAIASTLVLEDDTIEADMVLFSKAATLYKVTWELEENDNCELAVNDKGQTYIKILDNTTWSDEIKLTATIHGVTEGVSVKKEFIIYARQIPTESVGLDDFYANKDTDVAVELTGYVYSMLPGGFWITDETGYTVYIYTNTSPVGLCEVGDKVKVVGNKILFYSMYEVENPSVEVLEKGNGTYDLASMTKDSDIDTLATYDKNYRHLFGTLYNIEGVVIEDPSGKYTYAIESLTSGAYVVFYNSAMNDQDATKANLAKNLGKYVKVQVMVFDQYSSGFVRVLPMTDVVETSMPVMTDEQKVDRIAAQIEGLEKELAADATLPEAMEGTTVEWTSEKPEVLDATGKIKSRGAEDIEVKLTAVITAGEVTKTVDVIFVVKAVELKTALEATKIALSGKEEYIKIEGKIVAFDTTKYPYFYVADESGVTFVRTKLDTEKFAIGDSVSVVVKTTLYLNSDKEITPQLNVVSIEKLEKEIVVKEAETVEASVIAEKLHSGEKTLGQQEIKTISSNELYGKLVKVRVYISVRTSGDYTNVYLATENSATSPAGYYQHTSPLQDELKALDGKLVELVCPVYGYSASYGWRLGTAISYQEVTE